MSEVKDFPESKALEDFNSNELPKQLEFVVDTIYNRYHEQSAYQQTLSALQNRLDYHTGALSEDFVADLKKSLLIRYGDSVLNALSRKDVSVLKNARESIEEHAADLLKPLVEQAVDLHIKYHTRMCKEIEARLNALTEKKEGE